jgi:hypothetical protein
VKQGALADWRSLEDAQVFGKRSRVCAASALEHLGQGRDRQIRPNAQNA